MIDEGLSKSDNVLVKTVYQLKRLLSSEFQVSRKNTRCEHTTIVCELLARERNTLVNTREKRLLRQQLFARQKTTCEDDYT